jgi:hypothetical protein
MTDRHRLLREEEDTEAMMAPHRRQHRVNRESQFH